MTTARPASPFPADPLDKVLATQDYRRSVINGILESYNSNYDFLVEAVQNAVDALEDAKLLNLPPPYLLEITVNIKDNWIAVLDTGVGLSGEQIVAAFKPHVTLKLDPELRRRRGGQRSYRGYKGVGLTFLAYGTDDVRFHSNNGKGLVKARMQYGHAWAMGERDETAQIDHDEGQSPLERYRRGTYVRIQFSHSTRPKNLGRLASQPKAWEAIIRTRTAAGQVLLGRESIAPIKAVVVVTTADGEQHRLDFQSEFLFPHQVNRRPEFRFLDVEQYYREYPEHAEPPAEKRRQDGLYLAWNTDKIATELIERERQEFANELEAYTPWVYAFVPYQGSIWGEMNEILAESKNRVHLYPGLMLGVNRQRLADIFEIEATRYETFSRNVFVIVHFDNAKPDQGRKTVQDEVLELAKAAANRAVQYLAKQRPLLRPAGESPSPQQRQVERDHQDWLFNVQTHAKAYPLHIPPVAYASIPLTEQDVIGLFHQLSALGVFPGIKVYATSQIQTYDCLVRFECHADVEGLRYGGVDTNPLGLSPFVIGDDDRFETKNLTLEFKNNLDGLIEEIEDSNKPKSQSQIDVCVCWSVVSDRFAGYQLLELTEDNLDERSFPGVTHLLRRDGEAHVIQVIMLKTVVDMIQAGQVNIS